MDSRLETSGYTYADNLAYAAPTRGQRTCATIVALSAVAIVAAVAPVANAPAIRLPAFPPAFGAAIALALVATVQIIATQYFATRYPPLGFLALAYATQATLVIVDKIVFPETFALDGTRDAGLQAAPIFYVGWHVAFVALLAIYLACRSRLGTSPTRILRANRRVTVVSVGTGLFVVGAAVAMIHNAQAPTLALRADRLAEIAYYFFAPANLCAAVALLICFVRVTRLRTFVDLWLAVTLLALLCEEVLTATLSGGRYSYGWYFARIEWLIASLAFPAALVAQMSKIIAGLATANRTLEVAGDTDALTRLLNRRGFDARFADGVFRCTSAGEPYALLVVDVDEFKRYNDAFGHPQGDVALQAVATVIARSISLQSDFAARIGGEEFAIGLPNTGSDGASVVAEHIRAAIGAANIAQYPGSPHGMLTVSIGVASTEVTGCIDHGDLLSRADEALYRAKRFGRDRTSVAPQSDGARRLATACPNPSATATACFGTRGCCGRTSSRMGSSRSRTSRSPSRSRS